MAEPATSGLADVVQRVLRQEAALFQIASLAYQPFETRIRELVRVDAFTLGVARVSFWVLQPDPESIRCAALYLLPQDRHDAGTVLTAREFPRYFAALKTGQPIAAEDARTDPRTSEFTVTYLEPNGIGAMLDVPVFLGGELYGVVCHEHVGAMRTWTGDEQLFAMSVGQAIALSIEVERRGQTERALRDSERRFRSILEASPVPMLVSSFPEGKILYGNVALASLARQPIDELIGRHTSEFYANPSEPDGFLSESVQADLDETAVNVTSIWDVTSKRETEERLRRAALYDELTGLPNRVLLFDLLRSELARADRYDQQLAVMYLDLDDFKTVNDRFGHEAGDALLKSVAERIRSGLRAGDVPARMGGDEFVAVLPSVQGIDGAQKVADRIAEALAGPHSIDGIKLSCSVSIGILLVDRSYQDPSAVLRDADAAMYAAKQGGKSRTRVFQPASLPGLRSKSG
jgi:diguanylate cyclase (GGDEF)-like protein